jgi:CHAT domain-containing protein
LKTSEGIMPGTIRLNQAFTKQSLTEGLRSGAPVVHIASHFSYNSAAPERSFLLLGASHMTVEEMQDLSNPFEKVELLTLSACDTAMGSANGKEVEGLAYVAQSLGAKSVIASLWPVSDRGTDELMLRFYRIRAANPQITKSDAFNQAQLSALRGDEPAQNESQQSRTGTDSGQGRGTEAISGGSARLPLYKPDPNRPFAHPHFWAAFILIGNWK